MRNKSTRNNDINYIIPARIRQARVSRGYSMTDLAELVDVTKQAISKYEIGYTKPSAEVINKLIDVLDFPYSYFKKPIRISNSSNSAIFFRKNKSVSKKNQNALSIRLKWLDEIYQYLNDFIDFPEINLPDFNDLICGNQLDFETIEQVAIRLRKHWNLGENPINNLVELLEENGFIVSRIKFKNKKVDAFSSWYNNKAYILQGSDKESAVRARFSIAHELGHLILHCHIDQEDLKKKMISDQIEDEANYFASVFLLPSEEFAKDVVSSSLNHYVMLKKYWKVSISAMIKRIEQINLLTDNQVRYLKQQMTMNRYWRKEPLDNIFEFETPTLLREAIELLINNDIVTPKQISNELSLNKEDIDTLCFLPNSLLNQCETRKCLNLKIVR